MLHRHFLYRQLNTAKKQSSIFILCVALSIVTLAALNGFGSSVNQGLSRDAKQLQAADIVIESRFPIAEPIHTEVRNFINDGLIESTQIHEFNTVVRVVDASNTLLTNVKMVESGYPFYGEVKLASGSQFQSRLTSGTAIVEQDLLALLGINIGDQLHVGNAVLTIVDVAIHEPDRPLQFFNLGPRLFVSADDRQAIDLIKAGSRVEYKLLLKVFDQNLLNQLTEKIQATVYEGSEKVSNHQNAETSIKRFLDNLRLFLNLVGVFTLLMAGIGIQSALTAYLKEQEQSIAIIKTLGATTAFISRHYFLIVCILGLIGAFIGLTLGFFLQQFMPILLRGLIPDNLNLMIAWRTLFDSMLLGLIIVIAFTFVPLYRLQQLRPHFILRKAYAKLQPTWIYYLVLATIAILFISIILWQLQNISIGLFFTFGVIALLAIASLLTHAVLSVIGKLSIDSLSIRLALRGLFREGGATRAIIITLSTSLAAIFTIYLIEQNLDATFVQSYPEDTPNVVFLDIQPDQLNQFDSSLGYDANYYPIIRTRITHINNTPLDRKAERKRDRDNFARQFSVSYREQLQEDEILIKGGSLFNDDWDEVSVSVLDYILKDRDIGIGDRISFRIQGVPIVARISSIRSRKEETLRPFFVFLFPPEVLKNAPQTIFTSIKVDDPETIPTLQNRIVAEFPNVSVINISQSIERLSAVAQQLSQVIRFFSLFSIIAGILIIISAVFATRLARIQEAVYYKVLGAKGRFVLKVFTMENCFLGLMAAFLAILMAQIGSWAISEFLFDINYKPFISASMILIIATVMLVVTVALSVSISILKSKPITFLHKQTG